MAHPVKMITYQDLHKLNDSIKQLSNWHDKLGLIRLNSHSYTISDSLFYEHTQILNALDDEVEKLKCKPKLKNILI